MNKKWLASIALFTTCVLGFFLFDNASTSSEKEIKSFSFLKVNNPSLSKDIVINIHSDSLTGLIPYGANIKGMIPTFEFSGKELSFEDKPLHSGQSKIDLSSTRTMDVKASDGSIKSYILGLDYFTGLPIINLFTNDSNPTLSRTSYLQGTFTLQENIHSEKLVHDVKIRGRGNSSWGFPKRSMQIKFEKKESLCGMPKDKRWLLLANFTDKSLIRNELAFEMSRASNLAWTPDSRFVEVFINGNFQGVFQLTQKIEESKNRVNIGDDGFLIESENSDKIRPSDVTFRTKRHRFSIKEPQLKIDDDDYNYIKETINNVESVLFGKNFADPVNGYAKYIDVSSFVDWYLIQEISRNNDATFYSSVYFHLNKGGKLYMGPIWDYDIAFGNINYGDNEKTEGFYIKKQSRWASRLFQDPNFVEKVKVRMKFFSQQKGAFQDRIEVLGHQLRYSQKQNFNKWPILGKYVWPNSVYFKTHEEEIKFLSNWLDARITWLDTAIDDL